MHSYDCPTVITSEEEKVFLGNGKGKEIVDAISNTPSLNDK